MKNVIGFFRKGKIAEPPYEYDFLLNLDEKEYPKYLKKIFELRTGEKLDLKNPKTFNEKIQWIKLYGVTDLMRDCTDKVKVRDYVSSRIGEEYLKPALQIIPNNNKTSHVIASECEAIQPIENIKNQPDCHDSNESRSDRKLDDVSTYFDKIDFDKLPNKFVIKCNHGCKWQFIIKDKEDVLNTKQFVDVIRKNINGWLEQEYWVWQGLELQYKGIKPKYLLNLY